MLEYYVVVDENGVELFHGKLEDCHAFAVYIDEPFNIIPADDLDW